MSQIVADAAARQRVLENIRALGLEGNVLELEAQGYTIVRGALTPSQVERAKAGIVARAERITGNKVDVSGETGATYKGMQYIPYMLYEDPVYEEILMAPHALALVTWLLGESCLLSSIGCHLRGPGGVPLMLHSDNGNGIPPPFSSVAYTANVNYALTPYSPEAGALGLVPGSHRLGRQPTAYENFRPKSMSAEEFARLQRGGARDGALQSSVDAVEWTPPPNFVPMDLLPGDVVVWHGNTWHGGFKRELPGMRMNLAVFFNRQFVQTQERHKDRIPPEVLQRHANDERFHVLLGAKQPYGWHEEGPDYKVMGRVPVGQFD